MIGALITFALLQDPVCNIPDLFGPPQRRGANRSDFGKGKGNGRSNQGDSFEAGFNVSLYANLNLAALGGSGANDIWGYVSPSGREYALICLLDKLVFVEVSTPTAPVIVGSFGHPNSTWGDVKVYKDHCYFTNETSGTGIQVFDLSDIDNQNVTLVQTLTEITDAHNLAVDTDSGFLYTLISAGSTGTTICFDLTDPGNPVKTGANSLTGGHRMHDAQIVTYTSGTYAGRQILFGASEGNGLRIWDVTNKTSPFLVGAVTYNNVEYSHQCWLSADRNYLYLGDELDESRNGNTTKTLVFDVSDIANPTLASTFTNGLPSIDHNLYVHGGFVFESNYSSGLRIYDTNDDPLNPTEIGWYDTFPANNGVNFSGSWSNYPFFPSGTVILSDRQTGLYIFDVSAATLRHIEVHGLHVARGSIKAGGVTELESADGNTLDIKAGLTLSSAEAHIEVEFTGTSLWDHVSKMSLSLTGSASTIGLSQELQLYDWDAGAYVSLDLRSATTASQSVLSSVSNPDRFVQTGTRLMKARVLVRQTGLTLHWPWIYSFDQLSWQINP